MKRLLWVVASLAAVGVWSETMPQRGPVLLAADGDAKPAADPAATKLLADARAARAVWKDFPGFTADLEVNIDGKVVKGTLAQDLEVGMEMELAIEPLYRDDDGVERTVYAWRIA